MKPELLFVGLAAFAALTEGSELNRDSVFDSVDGFVTTMKAFQPGATKGKLAFLFTIPEIGAESRGKPVAALAIESCDTIWSDDKSALLFATAKPPTVGTDSHIGVLFLLVHQRDGWRIDDLMRFTAMEKDSGLSAKPTASAAIAHQLGSEGFDPVIMVNKHQGGRGYAYEICASYEIAGSKLKRFDLE
ncbi:MAG: hypothetical protein ACJ8KF_07020 [Chthoniobacterales bacterium]